MFWQGPDPLPPFAFFITNTTLLKTKCFKAFGPGLNPPPPFQAMPIFRPLFYFQMASLTLAVFNIEEVTPGAVFEAVDCLAGEARTGVGPASPRAVVLDCGRIGPWVHTVLSCPVVHPQVVVSYRERRNGTIDS